MQPMTAAPTASPLRIALLGYRGNPYSGGQGIYLKYLSGALADAGHSVTVIGGPPYPELNANVELVRLPSLDLFNHPNHVRALKLKHLRSKADTFEWWSMLTGGFAEPYTFGLRLLPWLKANGHKFDVVHDNQSLCSALLKLQRSGTPLVTTIHHPITWDRDIALAHAPDRTSRLFIRRWHSFLRMQTRVARGLNHIVTVSESSRKDIAEAFDIDAANIRVVHNGIDTSTFYPLPHIESEPLQLISTASADQPLKGTTHLVRALAKLRQTYPEIRLTIIGRPKSGGPTEALINELKLNDAISFRNSLTTEQIRELYAQASIAVVPSEYEGFGLPAGEAMACGVAVVSTDGGALPEVVGDQAVVVPAGDADALARGIAELIDNPTRRAELAEGGRLRILDKFNWGRAAEQMIALYKDVIAQPGSTLEHGYNDAHASRAQKNQ